MAHCVGHDDVVGTPGRVINGRTISQSKEGSKLCVFLLAYLFLRMIARSHSLAR